jgi:hypothetical protein
MYVDLASQESIRIFVGEFMAMGHPLHLLVRHPPLGDDAAGDCSRCRRGEPRMRAAAASPRAAAGADFPSNAACWQINNAGISMPGTFRATADGFEQTLATNFFGPCYLTLLLQVGRQLSWGRARWALSLACRHHYCGWRLQPTLPMHLCTPSPLLCLPACLPPARRHRMHDDARRRRTS